MGALKCAPMARDGMGDSPLKNPLQMSLFDAGALACAPSLPRPAPECVSAVATRVEDTGDAADELAPLHFQHPEANREVQLGLHRVGFVLRRARRRSIGFTINSEGLSVSVPRALSMQNVDAAVRLKAAWIMRKLHEQHLRARSSEAARIKWSDGAQVPFLGEPLLILLAGGGGPPCLHTAAEVSPTTPRWRLHTGLPPSAAPEVIRDAVRFWLQRQALDFFAERCHYFTAQLNVAMRRLSLSNARTRWGSASADGSIRLNWRLVHFEREVIDYVVVHELAHLREMNHGPAFWALVRSAIPDYERLRRALKETPVPGLG